MWQKVYAMFFCCLLLIGLVSGHDVSEPRDPLVSENSIAQSNWVDSVFNSLTFEERLGQLFMVAAYSNKGQAHVNNISKLIEEENLGGLIFFQGGPVRQANLTNYYQNPALHRNGCRMGYRHAP